MIFPDRFKGKTAIVTGGAMGIGEACAVDLAAEGANVVVVDWAVEQGQDVVNRIVANGGKAIFVETDVSDSAQVQAMIKEAVDTFGSIDVAANIAGIGGNGNLMGEMDEDDWDKVLKNNITGMFLPQKYEIRQMLAQGGGGSILNASSVGAFVGVAYSGGYITSKHAIMGLTRTAAIEYASKGIRVNALCPHAVRTPMLEAGLKRNPSLEQRVISSIPMGRLSTSGEMARMALFLLSDEASFCTGQSFVLDGGWLAQ